MINDFANDVHRQVMKVLFKVMRSKVSYMTIEQYNAALAGIGLALEGLSRTGSDGVKRPTRKIYQNSIEWVGGQYGVNLSMNRPDIAVMEYYQNKYFPPAFERMTTGKTPYNYKNTIHRILTLALDEHWNWTKTIREMNSYLDIQGKNFPRWMHERVVKSETARFVTEGHIRGHMKMGFTRFRRLETEDEVTNVDLCLPYNNHIYGAKEASGVIPAHPNSYHKDTEVYTKAGWKLIKDISKGELILSLNPDNFDLEYVAVANLVSHKQEQLCHFKSMNFDLKVTPDHDMFCVVGTTNHRKECRFVKAKDVPNDARFFRSSNWSGEDIGYMKIGKHQIKMDLFCKFMGAYLSEGNTRKPEYCSYYVKISQSLEKNYDKYMAFLEVLEDAGFKVEQNKEYLAFSDKDIWSYLRTFGKSYQKYVPDEIKNTTKENIRHFIDYYRMGDGSVQKVSGYNNAEGYKFRDYLTISTSSKRMADDLGELIIKVGKRPSYRLSKTKGTQAKFRNGTYTINHDTWIITECYNQYSQFVMNEKRTRIVREYIDYSDVVYCVELEKFHTLLVRYNGKVTWCGNCRGDLTPEPDDETPKPGGAS